MGNCFSKKEKYKCSWCMKNIDYIDIYKKYYFNNKEFFISCCKKCWNKILYSVKNIDNYN